MCSRSILAKQVERAAKLGLKFNLGIECETYIVRLDPSAHNGFAPNDPRDHISKAAYDASLTLMNLEFLNDVVWSMNQLGWAVHSFDHEDANGQFEFDFSYADVMTGSGAHFNMSLADVNTGDNVSGDAADKRGCGLSKRAYQFLGGLKKHAAAIVAVSCPTVTSA
jgi:glutamine synthetase